MRKISDRAERVPIDVMNDDVMGRYASRRRAIPVSVRRYLSVVVAAVGYLSSSVGACFCLLPISLKLVCRHYIYNVLCRGLSLAS